MPGSVLVSGARTPIGKLLGSLAGFQGVDLGGIAIEAALSRAGLAGARKGYKYGNGTLIDSMAHDGLFCAFDQVAMGESTERYNAKLGINREEQDAFAARSHERAALAQKNGTFDDELVPVPVPQR